MKAATEQHKSAQAGNECVQLIVGTAGHIDHGKTSLVQALTGVDTDTLPEEKERGISVDLGFAPLQGSEGKLFGFVDVPGHERFVKNMVAGVSGVDLVLLTVGADSGVQPQSFEHLMICELLGAKHGVIALTRSDLLQKTGDATRLLDRRKDEIKRLVKGTFLEEAEIIPTSVTTKEGLGDLKQALERAATRCLNEGGKQERLEKPFRMYLDRIFAKKGFGTVVTGSALNGRVRMGDQMVVHASEGVGPIETVVRKVESFMKPLEEGKAGMRLAINLQHADVEEIHRGSCLTLPDQVHPSRELLVHVRLLEGGGRATGLKHNSWIRLHWGTKESRARLLFRSFGERQSVLQPGQKCLARIKCEEPVFVKMGDPFIVRSQTPVTTVGGGVVLVPIAAEAKKVSPLWSGRWPEADLESLLVWVTSTSDDKESFRRALITAIGRCGEAGTTLKELAAFFDGTMEKMVLELEEELLQTRVMAMVEEGQEALALSQEEKDKGKALPTLALQRVPLVLGEHFERVCDRLFHELGTYALKHPEDPVINQESMRAKVGRTLPPVVFKRALREGVRRNLVATTSDGGVRLTEKGEKLTIQATGKKTKTTEAKPAQPEKKSEPKPQTAKKPQEKMAEKILDLVKRAGMTPPSAAELAVLVGAPVNMVTGFVKSLQREGRVVRLPGGLFLEKTRAEQLKQRLRDYFGVSTPGQKRLTIQAFKKITQTSRKYTVPLLEYCDEQKWTLRREDNSRLPGPNLERP